MIRGDDSVERADDFRGQLHLPSEMVLAGIASCFTTTFLSSSPSFSFLTVLRGNLCKIFEMRRFQASFAITSNVILSQFMQLRFADFNCLGGSFLNVSRNNRIFQSCLAATRLSISSACLCLSASFNLAVSSLTFSSWNSLTNNFECNASSSLQQ